MKNILTIGASNSSKSINKIFAEYTASKLDNIKVVKADLNDFELPIYKSDLEEASGIPENAVKFKSLIQSVDGIVLSMAEHNGLPSAAFKNLFDWLSRIDQNIWLDKPMLLLASSPGARGGSNVLNIMKNMLPYFGGNIVSNFSLPSFYENFTETGIKDKKLKSDFDKEIKTFNKTLQK